MTKITRDGKGAVRRETAVIDPATGQPICIELGPNYLTIWIKGRRTKYPLPVLSAYQRAAKAAADYEDPPRDTRRRRWRR